MHQDSPPGTQGRQPGEPEEGTLRAVTRQETRPSARHTLTQPKDARERVTRTLHMGARQDARYAPVRPLCERDHCIGACVGVCIWRALGTHQVITLTVELGVDSGTRLYCNML